jgi:hypothetical protein
MFSKRNSKRTSVTILVTVLFHLAVADTSRATVPVPSGFTLDKSYTGVRVYKKAYSGGAPDYVAIVDLRYASLSSFTGWAYNTPDSGTVERRTLRTHWNNAVGQNTSSRVARVAINGTFFDPNNNPSGIAFGLKANWWQMSYGFAIDKEYPGKELTLAYDSGFGSSSIQAYNKDMFNWGIPDLVGGLDNSANKDGKRNSYIARTYVGVRDDNGDGHSETVIFFASAYATQDWAVNILSGFGAGSKMMLDGGGSTGLIVNGVDYISSSRSIPQSFIVWSGK